MGDAPAVDVPDVWALDPVDVDAYLERIGVAAAPPSLGSLDELVAAHVHAFSFDNLDVLLGQHPGVTLTAVQAKLVGRGRGGYCFEHATLFAAVLARLGYDVTRRLGRVGDPAAAPRTHLAVEVLVDGRRQLADVGIGRPPLASVPLEDDAEVEALGWRHRIRRVEDPEPGWQLWREGEDGWEQVHTLDDLLVRPVDVAMGHHWTSTGPDSHFRTALLFGRFAGAVHTGVAVDPQGLAVTTRRPGQPAVRVVVDVAEGVRLVSELGGGLSGDEASRLQAVLSAFSREAR